MFFGQVINVEIKLIGIFSMRLIYHPGRGVILHIRNDEENPLIYKQCQWVLSYRLSSSPNECGVEEFIVFNMRASNARVMYSPLYKLV